ncbi:BamA/TamA family outer membrane protein [candidate division KSB1 bacterium]|nr:BamA/TamA family outer membrane protein [candidate division KSB1 bacterium]
MQNSVKQLLFFILLALVFFLIFGGLIFSARGNPLEATNLLDGNWPKGKTGLLHYQDDLTIEEHEQISQDVVVQNGTLTIKGEIKGDVLVFYGNVILKHTATIYGHLLVYQGEIIDSPGSKIAGDILEIYAKRTKYARRRDFPGIDSKVIRYHNSRQIDPDETVDGTVVIREGDLAIYGVVNGDVVAIDGDVKLGNNALVIGNIITTTGQIYIPTEGRIEGEVLQLHLRPGKVRPPVVEVEIPPNPRDEMMRERIERKFLRNRGTTSEGIFRFFGDVTIHENESIDGDVVITKGTVCVDGEVKGDVVAIIGDIEMGPESYVDGNVVSVGGKIRRKEGSVVTGDVVETSLPLGRVNNHDKRVTVDGDEIAITKRPRRSDQFWPRDFRKWNRFPNQANEMFMFRYNRVEGLFLGACMPDEYWWQHTDYKFALFGHLGYGFANKEVRYRIGLERWFFDDFRFTLGGEAYNLTESQDDWLIPGLENSLAAILIKEDFHDFYRRAGYGAFVKQNLTPYFQVKAGYRIDDFESMSRKTQWSLFGGHKRFIVNPAIDEIEALKSVVAQVALDTRDHQRHASQGWYIAFEGQFAGPDINPEAVYYPNSLEAVNFDRYILDIRRYQPLGRNENLDFRLRAATARGVLPRQYLFDMGGYSSLPGYEYKFFENGDRLVLANVEYRVHSPIYGDLRGLFDHINLIIFADAGLVWNSPLKNSYQEGFQDLTWADLKTDVGVAFTNHEGDIRLNIAKRTDSSGHPVVVTFRINRNF